MSDSASDPPVPPAGVPPVGVPSVAGTAVDDPLLDPAPAHDVRAVLRITSFRRLWLSLGLSSFGDWLGLLATTAMAASLGRESSYAAANLAVSGVLILRLAPAVVFGPLAGALADRLDRKLTMVVGDVVRAVLFVSIPLVGTLWWLFVATVLIEIVGLFWMPAKDATVPNLVPRARLEAANQLSLATTYGSAPFAALLFTGLALLSGALDNVFSVFGGTNDLALYVNAATYVVAAAVVWRLEMPPGPAVTTEHGETESIWRTILDGWKFIGGTPLVRGLVIGMLGAFGAGGFVIGVATSFVRDLGAGEPGYGVLFAAVFTGLAAGMWVGPRVLAELSRWRLFALAVIAAGLLLALLALIPNIVLATAFATLLGVAAGVAWVTGYTMLGLEVADELRGRTFAFVQSAARVVLVAVMAFAPALAALIGTHRARFTDEVSITYNGAALTLLVAAVLAVAIGVLSYRTMDDRAGVPLVEDVVRAFQRRHVAQPEPRTSSRTGFFVAVEGGDGAGKSGQVDLLEGWLADELGHEVLRTREPGATGLGESIRELVLHGGHVSPRAEALLFAADRAHHVETVVQPALARGAVVVTDRYVDSSIAYQGAGRDLGADDVAQISRWATAGLTPDLTILLDVDPALGRARRSGRAGAEGVAVGEDRVEGEADAFHSAVRDGFLALARRHPRRYLVVDASLPVDEIASAVRDRLRPVLPLSPRQRAELEARRAAEEAERARIEAERRREEEERRRLAAEQAERERVEAERAAEAERLAEEERREVERQEAERRRAAERVAAQRAAEEAERQRVEAQRVRAERAEAQRVAAAEQAQFAAHQAAADQAAADQAATQRVPADRVSADRAAAPLDGVQTPSPAGQWAAAGGPPTATPAAEVASSANGVPGAAAAASWYDEPTMHEIRRVSAHGDGVDEDGERDDPGFADELFGLGDDGRGRR